MYFRYYFNSVFVLQIAGYTSENKYEIRDISTRSQNGNSIIKGDGYSHLSKSKISQS